MIQVPPDDFVTGCGQLVTTSHAEPYVLHPGGMGADLFVTSLPGSSLENFKDSGVVT